MPGGRRPAGVTGHPRGGDGVDLERTISGRSVTAVGQSMRVADADQGGCCRINLCRDAKAITGLEILVQKFV
jgi:hypothetical protein